MPQQAIGYFRCYRHGIPFLFLFFISVSGSAATRSTMVTEIQRGDNLEKRIDVFTIDGANARLDMYSGDNPGEKNPPYMLTVDGGNTWFLSDPKANKAICTKWNTKAFFNGMGELLQFATEFVNADVRVGNFDITLNEPGAKMLGHSTRRLKLNYSLKAKASFLFIKREYTLGFRDEVWVSPELTLNPIEQAWVDAMSETGYKQLDSISKQWNQQVTGTVIKLISDVTLHNVTKNEKRHKQERIEIKKLETLKSTDIPAETFKVPACKKVSTDEMEEAAKDMLTALAK